MWRRHETVSGISLSFCGRPSKVLRALVLPMLVTLLRGGEFKVGEVSLSALDRDFSIPLYMTNDEEVSGVTVVLEFPEGIFTVTDASFDQVAPSTPEWSAYEVNEGWASFGWLMDYTAPYEGQTIPAGADQEIGRFLCRLASGVDPQTVSLHLPPEGRRRGPEGTGPLLRNSYVPADGSDDIFPDLVDGSLTVEWPEVSIDSIDTEFAGTLVNVTITGSGFIPQSVVTVAGEEVTYTLVDSGTIRFESYDCGGALSVEVKVCNGERCAAGSFDCGVPFLRGDPNEDKNIDIADPVLILGYLFGGKDLLCLDSADVNDDGSINIADAIRILGFLFSDSPAPSPPFPDPGLDPTPDELDCGEYPL